METDRSRRSGRRGVLRLALLVVAPVLLLLLLGPSAWQLAQRIAVGTAQEARSRELARARGQWEQRGPEPYELSITIGGGWGECSLRLAIERGAPARTLANGCTAPFGAQMYRYLGSPETVDDLFDYVSTSLGSRTCGPNGCACDGVLTVEADYHDDLGYPQSLRTHFKRHWTTMPWPLSSASAQGCTLIGTILPEDVRVHVEAFDG